MLLFDWRRFRSVGWSCHLLIRLHRLGDFVERSRVTDEWAALTLLGWGDALVVITSSASAATLNLRSSFPKLSCRVFKSTAVTPTGTLAMHEAWRATKLMRWWPRAVTTQR